MTTGQDLWPNATMRTKDVVEHYGNQSAVARELGISRQAVNMWGELVPLPTALRLEEKTKGKLKLNRALYVDQAIAKARAAG